MLSQFVHYPVVDAEGRRARLTDLAVDLAAGDYPVVTYLFYRGADKTQRTVPWSARVTVDWPARQICMPNLAAGDPAPPDTTSTAVLLVRDVLDALVLELQLRRATRANDLELQETDGRLYLCAADTSPWGVVRRLSGGRLRRVTLAALFDWKYVEFLRGDPQVAQRSQDYHRRIARLPPGEIARLSDALPYLHAAELIGLLPDPVAADALEALGPDRQVQVFEELENHQARRLLLLMRPDIVADLLGQLKVDEARQWLEGMAAAQRERVLKLLHYPEDTAGGIMTNDLVTLPQGLRAGQALSALRELLAEPDFINFIYDIFVVDSEDSQRLQGTLPLRDLIVADENQALAEIMNPYQMTLYPLEPAQEAARRVIDSELPALPVVARDGQLLGAVTVDAALALVAPGAWRSQAPRLFS